MTTWTRKVGHLGVLCIVLPCLTGGCTVYSVTSLASGLDVQELAPDRYRVSSHGSNWSSASTVELYGLLLAAEVTLEKGYRYFVIVRNKDSTDKGMVLVPPAGSEHGS